MEEGPVNLPEQKFERGAECIDLAHSPNFVKLSRMLRLHLLASTITSAFFAGVCFAAYNQFSSEHKRNFIPPSVDHFQLCVRERFPTLKSAPNRAISTVSWGWVDKGKDTSNTINISSTLVEAAEKAVRHLTLVILKYTHLD
jgi:hypothetical protein